MAALSLRSDSLGGRLKAGMRFCSVAVLGLGLDYVGGSFKAGTKFFGW